MISTNRYPKRTITQVDLTDGLVDRILRLLWSRTHVDENGCHRWQGEHTRYGYGFLVARPVGDRTHKIAWHLLAGGISEGMHVLHHCDVRDCHNVEHLYLGTPADNAADREQRGRAVHPAGAAAWNTTNSDDDRIDMVTLALSTDLSLPEIGSRYGVDHSSVRAALRAFDKQIGTWVGNRERCDTSTPQ